ncbi:MAG: hypothetical protein ACI4RH_07810, partial [Huintestinicola sp.]
ILMNKDIPVRYASLVQKMHSFPDFYTDADHEQLTYIEFMIYSLPKIAANRAVVKYPELYKVISERNKDNAPKEAKEYRTRKKSGTMTPIPATIPTITNKSFQNAMTLNLDDKAYLQPLSSLDNLVFENGILYFDGLPATAAKLSNRYTKEGIDNINLPILRMFYAIIMERFMKTWNEDKSIDEVISIYYPDLAKRMGKSSNISRLDIENFISTITSFQNIMGIVDKGTRGNDILPVLVFMGNDVDKNIIRFSSPYMVRVIQDIYKASIRKSKVDLPITDKQGNVLTLPSHSYLIKSSITKEKNKKAVEIVFIIVTLIEQAGNNVPHIKAETIVERNAQLRESLTASKSTSDKNKKLSRAFTKAWQLLRTQTDLMTAYKNIVLPDPKAPDFGKYIPTTSTLDTVYEFPHEGKIID